MVDCGRADLRAEFSLLGCLWRAPLLSLLSQGTTPDELTMDGICVAAAARGRRVGTTLLNAIKAEANRQGKSHLRLDVINSNQRARALWLRDGFVPQRTQSIGPLRHIFGFCSAERMLYPVQTADRPRRD